jgi:hypothetical protein
MPDSAPIRHTITKTRIGYHIGTTDGIFYLEEGMFALTLKSAQRKAERRTRRILRDREAQAHAPTSCRAPCSTAPDAPTPPDQQPGHAQATPRTLEEALRAAQRPEQARP